ncbi:rhamnan synthesis F family protein [Fulvimarina sp. MAC8]|uniref:rhamnan synthesis F family protein n=1 Tax=Fulvimarina sp. MAC8 TaxID=3162874 RepID=UPI0032EC5F10
MELNKTRLFVLSLTAPSNLKARLIVFVHVFHADVWSEIASDLAEAVDHPFALVLTSPHDEMVLAPPQTKHLIAWTRITTENRGRDVLPFLTAFRAIGQDFEFGLKLHTKRSLHRSDGHLWRRHLLGSLLRRNEQGLIALNAMEVIPQIGLVAPKHHLMPLANRLVLNRTHLKRIMAKTNSTVPLRELGKGTFAAGTMFWFRQDAIAPFAKADLEPLFTKENGELDGTPAHAAERLFAHVAEQRGYLATAEEALEALRSRSATGKTALAALHAINADQLRHKDNSFILGFRPFWQRHPKLFDAYATVRHLTVGRTLEILRARRQGSRR